MTDYNKILSMKSDVIRHQEEILDSKIRIIAMQKNTIDNLCVGREILLEKQIGFKFTINCYRLGIICLLVILWILK